MPVYEQPCFTVTELELPGGVLFGVPKEEKIKTFNLKTWNHYKNKLMIPALTAKPRIYQFVMCLVSARRNRKWNNELCGFEFKYEEDCVIAAYLSKVSDSTYKPGAVLNLWYQQQINFQESLNDTNKHSLIGGDVKKAKVNQLAGKVKASDSNFEKVWQASKDFTNLLLSGSLAMVEHSLNDGKSEKEALNFALGQFACMQYGWPQKQQKPKKKWSFFG